MLAYQHRTLTESPIENALALAERARRPARRRDAELHLVSHSRGGLVGELLARGMRVGAAPITPDDLALFDGDVRARDRAALEKLSAVLEQSRLRLTRFVRVACPARGTTLADRRLDRYFSVLVNLASLIPGLKAQPRLRRPDQPARRRAQEAHRPGGAAGHRGDDADVAAGADAEQPGRRARRRICTCSAAISPASACSGVSRRSSPTSTTATTTTGRQHAGDARRDRTHASPVRYWIDTGDQVTHFHYFARPDTARRLVSALTGSDSRVPDARGAAVGGHVGGLRQARSLVAARRVRAAGDHGLAADRRRPAGVDEPPGALARRPVAARRQRRMA